MPGMVLPGLVLPGLVLIVEDSETCATNLELALGDLPDLETRTARTAQEALGILATGAVCAIVTDLQLTGMNLQAMDGFDLIARVRANPRHARLPILVTSGDSAPGNSERLRKLGADAYFVKPYSPSAVRRTLERLLHAT